MATSGTRQLVGALEDFVSAFGYRTEASGGFLAFEDRGGISPVIRKIVGGQASAITLDEVAERQPEFVVVNDNPPEARVHDLLAVCKGLPTAPELLSFSRFLDRLWKAEDAVRIARDDAESDDETATAYPGDRPRSLANPAYVEPKLLIEGERNARGALLAAGDWLEASEQRRLIIIAGAGLGKTELLRVLEGRSCLAYENRAQDALTVGLPPVVLRVPLRQLSEFTLDAIATWLRIERRLDAVRNAEVLAQLLDHGRIALLLDGLDEMRVDRPAIQAGLSDLVRRAPGKLLLTCRTGYFQSEDSALKLDFQAEAVAALAPLDESAGVELLRKYGASQHDAQHTAKELPGDLRGVPLFLIWAWLSGYHSQSGESQADALLNMVHRFCSRDEDRVQLSSSEQMEALRNLAYEATFFQSNGAVPSDDAAALVGDSEAPFIRGPHALLRRDQRGDLSFRDPTFQHLFVASAIHENWSSRGATPAALGTWIGERLGEKRLTSLTVAFLGQLVDDDMVTSAWSQASLAPVRNRPFARRNLLAIALERTTRNGERTKIERARRLEHCLGSKDLRETNLAGLDFEMLDFDGWDLRSCRCEEARFVLCDFSSAQFDDSLRSADLSGCEFAKDAALADPKVAALISEMRQRRLDEKTEIVLNADYGPPNTANELRWLAGGARERTWKKVAVALERSGLAQAIQKDTGGGRKIAFQLRCSLEDVLAGASQPSDNQSIREFWRSV